MKKNALLIFLFLFYISIAFSVEQDSINILLENLQNEKIDSVQVKLFNSISQNYLERDIDESLIYARKALELSNKINFKLGIADANCNLGKIYNLQKKYQPAINYFLISIKIFQELGNKEYIAKAYNMLGYIHLMQKDNSQALDAFFKSLIYSTEINDDYQTAYSFNYIGNAYYNQERYELALDYYMQSLELRKKNNDKIGIAGSFNNIGEIYRLKKDYEKAFEYYYKSIELNKEMGNDLWLSINYQNLGSIFQDQKEYNKAIDFFQKAFKISDSIDDKRGISSTNNSIGNYFIKLNRNLLSLKYFNKALKTANEISFSDEILKSYLGLSNANKNLKNYNVALNYYYQYSNLKDSLNSIEKERQLLKLQSYYEHEITESQINLKDNEIELLERNKKINQLQQTILIAGILLLLFLGVFGYTRQKSKIRKDRELIEKNKEIHEAQKNFLNTAIENKSNELINFALHIVHKNEFIQSVKSDVKNLKNKTEEEKSVLIKNLIFKITQNLRVNHELEEFQQDVDKVNRDFFSKLFEKYPDLTRNEKQLSALLRLNLSSKEIASLNSISTKAVEMSRYRLRKKLNLGQNANLTDFLQNI